MNLSLDFQHSLRLLRKNKAFVAICVLVIGLGMGLSITMYSSITNTAYKKLPFPGGDRFVVVQRVDRDIKSNRQIMDSYTYRYLKDSVQSFEVFDAYRTSAAVLSDGEVAEQFFAADIMPDLLRITGVEPLLGRRLLPGDERVVLISYRLWQNYYAGREDIIGRASRINGLPYTIVGVMPEGFAYPIAHDLWLPLQLAPNPQPGEDRGVNVIGLLKENVSMDSVNVELDSLMLRLGEDLPDQYANHYAIALPYIRGTIGSMIGIYMLTAVTVSLLLLVCLNVANLLMVRANERKQELAVRSALGASPARIVQSVLFDSMLICLLGALLGIFLGDLGMALINSIVFEMVPSAYLGFWYDYDWNFGTAVAALLIILLIWLFSGGMAAWQVSSQDISKTLGGGSTGTAGSGRKAGSAILVCFEIIFSCFLLILCGVFLGTARDLNKVDFGTATEGYVTGMINLPPAGYPGAGSQILYQQNLRLALLDEPGVDGVTFTTALPSQRGVPAGYSLEDRDLLADGQYPVQDVVSVAADYFNAMDVSLLSGRIFDASDTADSLPVVIIDELFASQAWPGESPLGKRIQINPGSPSAEWLTIVGVTSHIIQGNSFNGRYESSLYRPFTQAGNGLFSVVIDADGNPGSFRQTIQEAALRVNRDIPVTDISTLAEVLNRSNASMNVTTYIFSNIAFITLVLAVTGIYALVSRSVMQRTKEIGIRRALGSSNGQVLWLFLRKGLKYLCLGLLIGGGGAIFITAALDNLVNGLLNNLPSVLIGVGLLLGALIFIASYVPASKLVTLEPGDTLHYE